MMERLDSPIKMATSSTLKVGFSKMLDARRPLETLSVSTGIRLPPRLDGQAVHYLLVYVTRHPEAVVLPLVHFFWIAENKHTRNVLENSDHGSSGPICQGFDFLHGVWRLDIRGGAVAAKRTESPATQETCIGLIAVRAPNLFLLHKDRMLQTSHGCQLVCNVIVTRNDLASRGASRYEVTRGLALRQQAL